MRTVAAAFLIAAAGLIVAPASHADAPTCQGQPATLVGIPSQPLSGTDGPDVVVTNGADPVRTLAGDDLVCVTGLSSHVDAGAGNDSVDATARKGGGATVLGGGDDSFVGGSAPDTVVSGKTESVDLGSDVVTTGGGGAQVFTGQGAEPNADRILLGTAGTAGNGVSFRGDQVPDGSVTFGAGPGRLDVVRTGTHADLTVDNHERTVLVGERLVLRWSGTVTDLGVEGLVNHRLTFVGTAADETLRIGRSDRARVSLRMAGGDDTWETTDCAWLAGSGAAFGGTGRDLLRIRRCHAVGVFLEDGLYVDRDDIASVQGFDDVDVTGGRVRVGGFSGPNDLEVHACRAFVEGGAGADLIRLLPGRGDCVPVDRAHGGRDADRLVGSPGDDVLVGGQGAHDVALGRGGEDVCDAETTRGCERT